MYYVLLIQLHHPFIARGHSSPIPLAVFHHSFDVCAKAAEEIVSILVAYNRTFSIRKAPYLIAYATYVSAIIHIRCAAKQASAIDNMSSLSTCLELLDLNQDTNSGVRNAKASLKNLRDRLGVSYLGDQSPFESRPGSAQLPLDRYSNNAISPSGFPAGRPPSVGLFSNARAPSGGGGYDSSSNFEIDGFLKSFSGNQLSPSQSSGSISQDAGSVSYPFTSRTDSDFHFSPPGAFETALLDPVGVDYGQAQMRLGEQARAYTGMSGYGQSMHFGDLMGDSMI